MAVGDIHLRFAWHALHLGHWAGSGGTLGPGLVAGDAAALCVAGVAHGDICLRFAWQAWHLGHWTRSGAALGPALVPFDQRHFTWQAWLLVTSTFVSRGMHAW